MQAFEVMQRLAATRSRSDKEQIILDAYMTNCHEFFIGCMLALDNLVSFGIKKVAEILEDDGAIGTLTFQDFLDLTTQLKTRALTGHAARDAIHAAAECCHFETWNRFYRRILLKDLNVGVDESTINKVLSKLRPAYPDAAHYLIPVFKVQLAHDGEDPAHQKKIHGKKLIDTKLDGMRVLAVMDKANQVNLFTRNGLLLDTFPEITAGLMKILERLPGSLVLDGELMSPRGFQHLMTLVKRKEPHPDTEMVQYAMFDIIPLQDFRDSYCAKPQYERRAVLESLQENGLFSESRSELGHQRFYVVPQIEVDLDTVEGMSSFNDFNLRMIDSGYEGIMIKDPQAPYVGKRTTAWLKKKPWIEVTLAITGVEPGKVDGKYAHTTGAVVCEGFDLGVNIKSNVAGMTDEVRDQIWKDRDAVIGMMVEVIADKLTLEDGATIWSLRFPRLKGFRGTMPGEKL
jgi:DNA ligase-1